MELKDWITIIGIGLTFVIGIFNLFNGIKINKRTVFVNAITSERVKWMGQLKELIAEYLSLTTFYERKPVLEGEDLAKYFERLIYLQNRIKLHLNYVDLKDEEINLLIEKINKKIFGIYEAKEIISLPKKDRFDAIPEEIKQEYFDKVLRRDVDKETAKKIIATGDKESLIEVFNKVVKEISKDFKEEYGYKGKKDLIEYTNKLVDKSRRYLKVEWEKVKDEAEKGKLKKEKWYKKIY